MSGTVGEFCKVIDDMHGGSATLAQSVSVTERFEDETLGEDVVDEFDRVDNPQATCAYALSSN